MTPWIPLVDARQIDEIKERSKSVPCVVFKHSTRCSISSMAQFRLEEAWDFAEGEVEPYFLDLIAFRHLSNQIAEDFQEHHESPQLLLIVDGECVYEASHLDIDAQELRASLPGVS
jgi:bacillithiol system protein YtxJ